MKERFRALRPLHWLKNLLVLAPLFFSGNLTDVSLSLKELLAFAGFCCASSHIYIVNDIADVDSDRAGGPRAGRPFSSGKVSRNDMAAMAAVTAAAALYVAVSIGGGYLYSILFYVAVMHLYTFFFKRLGIAGVLLISAGMLVRIFSGAAAISVPVSHWVYPCAFLLAFYVVYGKRLYNMEPGETRNLELSIFRISGILTFAAYIAYSFSGVGIEKYNTTFLWITAPFVAAAIFRYHGIILQAGDRYEHLQAVLRDVPLIATVTIWAAVFAGLIYL